MSELLDYNYTIIIPIMVEHLFVLLCFVVSCCCYPLAIVSYSPKWNQTQANPKTNQYVKWALHFIDWNQWYSFYSSIFQLECFKSMLLNYFSPISLRHRCRTLSRAMIFVPFDQFQQGIQKNFTKTHEHE